MEKEERVDKAFENLTMGRSSHAEFRGELEDRLEDFCGGRDAGSRRGRVEAEVPH